MIGYGHEQAGESRTIPLPPGVGRRAAVDLDGGLVGGDGDVLDHDALLAGGPVALERLKLGRVGPQQLHRQTAYVVELGAVAGRSDLAQQSHGNPMNPNHLHGQHRLGFVLRPDASHRGQGGVQVLFRNRLVQRSQMGGVDDLRDKRFAKSRWVVPNAFINLAPATLG